jgi:hypothetical protein
MVPAVRSRVRPGRGEVALPGPSHTHEEIMHEERLRQLRRVVTAAPADRFVMDRFCRASQPCGTAYCAAGWAVLDPWFQKETPMLDYFEMCNFNNETVVISYDPVTCFRGLATIFDLDHIETEALFGANLSEGCKVFPAAVIANIDRLLQGEATIPYAEGEGYIPFEDEEELDEGDEDEEEDDKDKDEEEDDEDL